MMPAEVVLLTAGAGLPGEHPAGPGAAQELPEPQRTSEAGREDLRPPGKGEGRGAHA